jgi:hypothetical protein
VNGKGKLPAGNNSHGQREVLQLQIRILERDIQELRQFSEEKKRIPGVRRMLQEKETQLADLQKELQ